MSRNGRGGAISRAISNRDRLLADCTRQDRDTPMPGAGWRRRGRFTYDIVAVGSGSVRVHLQTGRSFLIDEADWERFGSHRATIGFRGVVSIKTADGIKFLAPLLVAPGDGLFVDHINGDPSDNRRVNLRVCTPSQNARNSAISTDNTSGFKGVSRAPKSAKPFRAYGYIDGRQRSLGTYWTAADAAHAYDDFARHEFGEFACLNFPNDGEQSVHRRERF